MTLEQHRIFVAVAEREHVTQAARDLRPWVLREAGSGTRAVLEDALRGLGLNPADIDVALELPSNEAVRAAVEAGSGVTVVSGLVANNSIKAGSLFAVELALPRRSFSMLHHKERYITKAVQASMSVAASL